MFRIKDLKVQKYGERGLSITLPIVFAKPRKIEPKNVLPAYLSKINNIDCLVIAEKELPELSGININTNESKAL